MNLCSLCVSPLLLIIIMFTTLFRYDFSTILGSKELHLIKFILLFSGHCNLIKVFVAVSGYNGPKGPSKMLPS